MTNTPDRPKDPRRESKRQLMEAAFVVLTLVVVFIGFVYWYQRTAASYRAGGG